MRHGVEHAIGRGIDDLAATTDRRRADEHSKTRQSSVRGSVPAPGDADDFGAQRVVDLLGGDVGQFDRRIVHGGMDYQIRCGILAPAASPPPGRPRRTERRGRPSCGRTDLTQPISDGGGGLA